MERQGANGSATGKEGLREKASLGGSGWVDSAITILRMEFRKIIGELAGGDLGEFLASGLAAEQAGKFQERSQRL